MVIFLLEGANGRIAAQIWAIGIFALVALYSMRRDGLFSFFIWRPTYIKEALAFGVPLIPHVAGIFLLSSVDRIVINSKLGLAQAGVYVVAVQLAAGMGLIFDAINKAYVPWLYEHLTRDIANEKKRIVKYSYIYFFLALLTAALAFVIGPYAIRIIAGEKYTSAGQVIGWLALGQAFNGMYLMVTNYIFYSKQTGLLSITTITSGLINVALLLALTQIFGLQGAAAAFSISMAIRFLFTWWVAQKRHPMPWFTFS